MMIHDEVHVALPHRLGDLPLGKCIALLDQLGLLGRERVVFIQIVIRQRARRTDRADRHCEAQHQGGYLLSAQANCARYLAGLQ